MHALILIDQQKGIDHPKLGLRNNPSAEAEISSLLSLWRQKSWPIFHVKHRSKQRESVFWPDQEGFEFKEAFLPLEGEATIEKSVPCAFINNSLDDELKKLGVNEIVLVGVATNNSVESTARTGGNLGYTVYVIDDACFTFAKPDYFGLARSADEVHAMSLANLHGEYATVISREQLVEKVIA
ncbi:cysteine hydrolase family protein [Marinomonas balearica]|uniref:Nicotinamidase-related amidase n=1 Tax=Marinomonas balearica TaxID=491947 RepID=A0A4R6M3H6_9GAMM|nr:cysteine hydrolase family protein [Marinomonas balearica]TDO95793.1 nicotinamidase-related amidase [Marinomonas balearica]